MGQGWEDRNRGRKLRKSKRQCNNAFVARPCRFHRWRGYDWGVAICSVFLFIFAFMLLSWVSIQMDLYRVNGGSMVWRKNHTNLESIIKAEYYYQTGRSYGIYFMLSLFYVTILLIFTIYWLRRLRNLGTLIILVLLFLLGICFFASIGSLAINESDDPDAFSEKIYKFVTDRMKEKPTKKQHKSISYKIANQLEVFSGRFNCCGIRSIHDWREWNEINNWKHFLDSIPNQCCMNHSDISNVDAQDRSECENMEILKENENSALLKRIHKKSCGSVLLEDGITDGLLLFIIFAFIIAIWLLILLLVIIFLFYCVYAPRMNRKKMDGEDYMDPLEQEDLQESDILPGTPAKSMMSESENTFYAP